MRRVVTAAAAWLLPLLLVCVSGTPEEEECPPAGTCSDGVILPVWTPVEGVSTGTTVVRALVYLFALFYMFAGVSIIADKFMEAIEVITSTTSVKVVNGQEVEVQVWNETVANLTLMALGSSAPEILLSVIEIMGNNFEAGELGPGTIVGSAAFNLFVITGICVACIPDGQVKMIKNFSVFACTASWSVFAYVWLYLMIAVITPEKVDWWEGLITLVLMLIFVLMSYMIDRHGEGCYVGFRIIGIVKPEDEDDRKESLPLNDMENGHVADNPVHTDFSKRITEKKSTKEKIVERLREVVAENPGQAKKWHSIIKAELPGIIFVGRSRAFFRLHKIDTDREVKKYEKFLEETIENLKRISQDRDKRNVIFCAHQKMKFPENVGQGRVTIERVGPFLNTTTTVHYKVCETDNKKANKADAGKDFETKEGTLKFEPGVKQAVIEITIHDDPDFEEDEEFLVILSDLTEEKPSVETDKPYMEPKLASERVVCVILDDDHHGKFAFPETAKSIAYSAEEPKQKIRVERTKGCRGKVRVPFEVVTDGKAQMGKDFNIAGNAVIFEHLATEGFVEVELMAENEQENKDLKFTLVLKDPEVVEGKADVAEAQPGIVKGVDECVVSIVGSITAAQLEDLGEGPETHWPTQIRKNLCLDPADEPGLVAYIWHYLMMPFNIVFCVVPPPGMAGGIPAFVVAITVIGLLTALIGDLAGAFGCTVGLKDTVTAITLVALGTSLPDTFASKTAALNDKYADSSIGNVTGSNAVNVFLGVGIAWFIAAVYHEIKGTEGGFVVPEGSLGLSTSIFLLLALVCIATLVARRVVFKTELGGPTVPKYLTSAFFVALWLIYVTVSTLNAYCVISSPI